MAKIKDWEQGQFQTLSQALALNSTAFIFELLFDISDIIITLSIDQDIINIDHAITFFPMNIQGSRED